MVDIRKKVKSPFSRPENLFLLVALFFGIILCILIPPDMGYDETTHIARIWEISSGHFIPNSFLSTGPNFPAAFADISYRKPRIENVITPDSFINSLEKHIDWDQMINTETRSVASPVVYLPQAFIMGLMERVFDFPVLTAYFSMRLSVLIIYVFLGYLAIRAIPFGKWLTVLLMLAPMAMYQAATVSIDPYTNGIGFLFIAWVLKLSQQNERVTLKQALWLMLITCLLFNSKANSVFLILLLVLIPAKKYEKKGWFLGVLVFTVVSFLVCVVGWNLVSYSTFHLQSSMGYNAFDQMKNILNHPFVFMASFVKDLGANFSNYIVEWIGVYGSQMGRVPTIMYYLFGLLLISTLLFDIPPKPVLRKTRLILVLTFLVGYILTIILLYLATSKVGDATLRPAQGRYFIFIQPLLLLALIPNINPLQFHLRLPFLIGIGSFIILAIFTFGIYCSFHLPCGIYYYTEGECYQPVYRNWDPTSHFTNPLVSGDLITQSFVPDCEPVDQIRIWTKHSVADHSNLTIAVLDENSGKELFSEEIPNNKVATDNWTVVPISELENCAGRSYLFELGTDSLDLNNTLQFSISLLDDYTDGVMKINGSPQEYDLFFQYGCNVSLIE